MSAERTVRWLWRGKEEMARLNSLSDTLNPHQLLFGINQGCTFEDIRIKNMEEIVKLDLDGYAIGGLAVGEPAEEMYRTIEAVEPIMPKEKIRYLMGVGTPVNIIEGVYRGEPYKIERAPLLTNSLHVEYDFPHIKPYDCIDISTENDSFYCFPTKENVVTKLSLAVEEIYKIKIAEVRK